MAGITRLLRRNRIVQNAYHSVTPTTLWVIVAFARFLHRLGGTDKSGAVTHKLRPGETLIIRQDPLPKDGKARASRPSIRVVRTKS